MRGYRATPDVSASINPDLLFSLSNQGTLIVCKFLEVWTSFGTVAKSESRVIEVRRCVQPIVDRIEIWDGMSVFRDSVLAHTYETTDGKLISPQFILQNFSVPSHHAEVMLLVDLVIFAVMAVLCAFSEAYLGIRELFGFLPSSLKVVQGITLGTEIFPAVKEVLRDVDTRLALIGVEIKGEVAQELSLAAGHDIK